MYVIVTCKYEMDPIKNSREKVEIPFFPIISLWGFFQKLKGNLLSSHFIVIGPLVANIFMFEIVDDDGQRPTTDDDGWTPDHGYSISSPSSLRLR